MSAQQSKATLIAERQANLPLPEDPPTASDFNSLDARTVNVGRGRISGNTEGLREPAAGDSAVRNQQAGVNTLGQDVGRQAKDGLEGLPNDALTGDKRSAGVETRN